MGLKFCRYNPHSLISCKSTFAVRNIPYEFPSLELDIISSDDVITSYSIHYTKLYESKFTDDSGGIVTSLSVALFIKIIFPASNKTTVYESVCVFIVFLVFAATAYACHVVA